MISSDYHVHSSFSGDCDTEMELFIEYAIANNFTNICFTDHHDLDFPDCGICFQLNIDEYINNLIKLKEKYNHKINLFLGIELGIQSHIYKEMSNIVKDYPFDFILCSNHLVNGIDPYNPEYFKNKTKKEAYCGYFNEILNNVKNYSDFDVYGHLDYAIRYSPYKERNYEYNMFSDIIDEILTTIISKGKGIEINTSGYKHNLNNPHPNVEVIKRYKELGGEIITIGSDAHSPERIGDCFDIVSNILLDLGYKYYTIFKNRKAEFIKL